MVLFVFCFAVIRGPISPVRRPLWKDLCGSVSFPRVLLSRMFRMPMYRMPVLSYLSYLSYRFPTGCPFLPWDACPFLSAFPVLDACPFLPSMPVLSYSFRLDACPFLSSMPVLS